MKGLSSPISLPFSLLFILLDRLFGKKKKRRTPDSAAIAADREKKKKENLSAMQVITDRYKDHTAEVITFYVKGIRRVEKFREFQVGDSLEIRLHKDGPKIFAHGEFITLLTPDSSSQLEHLLKEGIPFHAYLGGRDMSMIWNPEYDFCTLIIFYKLPGIAPTTINLEG